MIFADRRIGKRSDSDNNAKGTAPRNKNH